MAITNLKINGLSSPMGYDPGPLLFSWLVENSHASKQAHARIQVWAVARSGDPLWEIGGNLNWEGTPLDIPLQACTRYFIDVTVTDDLGEVHSGETWFETGKLGQPWLAQWISPDIQSNYAPILTGRFPCRGNLIAARLYIVGLGLYDAQLNGMPLSNEVLAPGVWDYEGEVQYQTFDVTSLICEENDFNVMLGNGWYKGRFGLEQARPFGEKYALLAELHMAYSDGTQQVFCTDESWLWRESDIAGTNGIYDGETLDRLSHECKENPPRPVRQIDVPLRIVERITPPTVEAMTLPVVEIINTPAGETVLDFGQNHTGWLRFHSTLPKNTKVHFEFGEVLQNDNFYNDNYRSAIGGFTYCSDGREETVCQKFTFYGFRYVKVNGWPGTPNPADFESPVLHTALDRTGWLMTGNQNLNQLYENTLWGQRSNFLSIPTDCPQRDERLGWTGDAQIFAPTACYNMDCRAFYRSFLRFLRLEQIRHNGAVPTYVPSMGDFTSCALWSDAATLIPGVLMRFSGVPEQAAEHYPLMRDWVNYVTSLNPGYLYTEGFQFGDWLAQDGIAPQSFKGGTDDSFLASVYRMISARITADHAQNLGKEEDAEKFIYLAERVKESILDNYFTPTGRLSVDTQAAYVTALHFGLWRNKDVLLEQFRRRLQFDNYQIRCGFAGAPLLCSVLAENGLNDLACDLLLHRGFPGWMYAVEMGATTIWERWNSLLADGTISGTGMNSLNHYAYGSVIEYVYAYLAGLRPGNTGFRHAIIAPQPDIRLRYVNCSCQTTSGLFVCNWHILEDGELSVHIEVPFGCTAEVTLPRSPTPSFVLSSGSYDYVYFPTHDYRLLYTIDTRLSALAEDPAAQSILGEEFPQLLGILNENNLEFTTQTFRELSHAFFLGLTPDGIARLITRLETLHTN